MVRRYGATVWCYGMVLCALRYWASVWCYELHGTGPAYGRVPGRYGAMGCAVLTPGMVLRRRGEYEAVATRY
eukprot:2380507-Rhodomonas_salina.1